MMLPTMASTMSLRTVRILAVLIVAAAIARGQTASEIPSPARERKPTELKTADDLYDQGKYADAANQYRSVLKANPTLESAQVGLALALLADEKVDDAFDVIKSASTGHSDSAESLAVLGNVSFRLGQMGPAEEDYIKALKLDSKNVRAYVGLARPYYASALRGHAFAALKRAHELDPNDSDAQLLWMQTLPPRERITAVRAYLAQHRSMSEGEREDLQQELTYLEKTADQPAHSCTLANQADQTEIKLKRVRDADRHVEGSGVEIGINKYSHVLLLDSGASGITITSKAAEKAGIQRLVDIIIYGIGDRGGSSGYLGVADRIVIGGLEFRDCLVDVSDRKPVPDIDGLIGTDVFASYLIDLDIPRKTLKLSELPQRPGEANSSASLNSEGQKQDTTAGANSTGHSAAESSYAPKDRYVDPAMSNWVHFFRFEHNVLIPTVVNQRKYGLFVMDTGAFDSVLSTRMANSVTDVQLDKNIKIRGVSGNVKKVYSAERVDLQFGRFHQPGEDVTTIDLENLSSGIGTEISGFFGYGLLSMLEIKIDYRDQLVDFSYRDSRCVVH